MPRPCCLQPVSNASSLEELLGLCLKSLAQCTPMVTRTNGSMWLYSLFPWSGSTRRSSSTYCHTFGVQHRRSPAASSFPVQPLHSLLCTNDLDVVDSQNVPTNPSLILRFLLACVDLELPLHVGKRKIRASSAPILSSELVVHGTKASPWCSPSRPSCVTLRGPRLPCNIVRAFAPSQLAFAALCPLMGTASFQTGTPKAWIHRCRAMPFLTSRMQVWEDRSMESLHMDPLVHPRALGPLPHGEMSLNFSVSVTLDCHTVINNARASNCSRPDSPLGGDSPDWSCTSSGRGHIPP